MSQPIRNLRITLWGVQGSCPYFPAPHEVAEYTRQVAVFTATRVIEDTLRLQRAGGGGVENLLGGAVTPEAIARYQERIGLPPLPIYGGETTCVEVETSDGEILILDGGSGIRHCALHIVMEKWKDRTDRVLHIFGSHQHLDHRSGLPFASICFVRPHPFHLHIYGNRSFLTSLDERFGLFSRETRRIWNRDAPMDYRIMSATFQGTELRPEGDQPGAEEAPLPCPVHEIARPIHVGRTVVRAFEVYHGLTPCLGYQVTHGGAKFVFCTDHELRHGPEESDPRQRQSLAAEARVIEHSMDADVAYYDGQYVRSEYEGRKGIGQSAAQCRMDWGHTCLEDVVERARKCRVKRTYVGHHDPEREWPEQVRTDQDLQRLKAAEGLHVELAKGSTVIEI